MNLSSLIEQVKLNCNISDANYWGYYSICGLLMRLRELYRSEHQMLPWERIEQDSIAPWIEKRESLWSKLEGQELRSLVIDSQVLDPFDARAVQKIISSERLVYAAGYSILGKPSFFLAEIEKKEDFMGFSVYYTFGELCRDLSTHPAMQIERSIYIRREPLLTKLWNRYMELRGRRFGGAVFEAFSGYGIDRTTELKQVQETLLKISEEITDILLYHEVAEAVESEGSDEWLEILSQCTDLKVDLYLRTIKDIISDTSINGPIKHLIEQQNERLLDFYIILTERLHRTVSTAIIEAYQKFKEHSDWQQLDETRRSVYLKFSRIYNKIIDIWKDTRDMERLKRYIINETL